MTLNEYKALSRGDRLKLIDARVGTSAYEVSCIDISHRIVMKLMTIHGLGEWEVLARQVDDFSGLVLGDRLEHRVAETSWIVIYCDDHSALIVESFKITRDNRLEWELVSKVYYS